MTITLDLKPEVEAALKSRAEALGLSIDDFLSKQLDAMCRVNPRPEAVIDGKIIVDKLRACEAELKHAGIEHLFLFGSYARGTHNPTSSDVDVIAEFDRSRKPSLLGRVHLENRLTDILGVKADLADRKMLLPEVLEQAERESVLVF